jgi:GntR family transcriptional regulator
VEILVKLSRTSPVHLYAQIANVLRARIDDGEYAVGQRISSEIQLSKEFGVSAVTVRQALDELKSAGILEGRQGAGTYVAMSSALNPGISLSVPLESVSDPMAEFDVTLLSRDVVTAPRDIAVQLGIAATETCVRVRRLRRAPQGPVSYATSYYPMWIGEQLTPEDLHRPLLMDALEMHGVHFSEATQSIEASLASVDTAEVLEVPVGSPILLVRRAYELSEGAVGYVVLNRHPSPMFRYEARLTRRVTPGEESGRPSGKKRPRWVLDASTDEHS